MTAEPGAVRRRSTTGTGHHPHVTPEVLRALLDGGRIVSVYSHEGSPGGHNNDRLVLTMESGKVFELNAYVGYFTVKVHEPASEGEHA